MESLGYQQKKQGIEIRKRTEKLCLLLYLRSSKLFFPDLVKWKVRRSTQRPTKEIIMLCAGNTCSDKEWWHKLFLREIEGVQLLTRTMKWTLHVITNRYEIHLDMENQNNTFISNVYRITEKSTKGLRISPTSS